jgi:hypothetical protein
MYTKAHEQSSTVRINSLDSDQFCFDLAAQLASEKHALFSG